MTLTLTPDEEKFILKKREEEAKKAADKILAFRRLQTAWEYAMWLDETGAGSTYSTFCEDFEYMGAEDEDRPKTYEIVMKLIELVNEPAALAVLTAEEEE